MGAAVCILSVRKRFCVFIEDIVSENVNNLYSILEIVHEWSKRVLNTIVIEFRVTEDVISNCLCSASVKDHSLLDRYIKPSLMPRKITKLGERNKIKAGEAWYVTPAFFEGR